MDKLTNSEIKALIDYVKGMIQDNKEPEKKAVIALCNELERINNLRPFGYLSVTAAVCLRRGGKTIITPENKGNSTPLYRLDK
ncbi:hypothetical protein Q4R26_13395 [Morganella morganii]|uniref:hypothetical protein n=1 Tax=Morganella morganii TaxID=582 RepID=UPI000B3FD5DC|nr:hypothetical protein [Morganella morganii]OVF59087.1 hypothetical protein B5724_00965 [Morganella morganii]